MSYAGFWKRFLAHILDRLILGFVTGILFIPIWFLGLLGYFIEHGQGDYEEYVYAAVQNYSQNEFSISMISNFLLIIIIIALINIVVEWLYFALMESSSKQATFGKIIVGIKVTDLDGNKISFARASGRYFSKYISGLILGIGYILAGVTEKKQALHDILASCLVINKYNF